MKETTGIQRTGWVDLARWFAMVLVVACHCADPFNCTPNASAEYKLWGAIYGSMLRACVPLFVMITGFLLLPVREEVGSFYRKRLSRVVWPFLIWSVVYSLFPWIVGILGYGSDVVALFFPYATWGGVVPAQDLMSALKNVAMIPLNFNSYSVHMWYAYLLIGLYLFMPIFSAWFAQATEQAKRFFLALWGVSLFLPYLREFVAPTLLGVCAWNEFGTLHCFSGFVGYLLLGSVMGRMRALSWCKTLLIAIPAFIVGYFVSFWGIRTMYVDGATDAQIELFWTYCSPNVVLMTVSTLLILKKISIPEGLIPRLLNNFASCCFGIYMTHYLFIGPAYYLTKWLPVSCILPASTVVAFTAAWATIALVHRLLPRKLFRIILG